jgi:hypothetical protein
MISGVKHIKKKRAQRETKWNQATESDLKGRRKR